MQICRHRNLQQRRRPHCADSFRLPSFLPTTVADRALRLAGYFLLPNDLLLQQEVSGHTRTARAKIQYSRPHPSPTNKQQQLVQLYPVVFITSVRLKVYNSVSRIPRTSSSSSSSFLRRRSLRVATSKRHLLAYAECSLFTAQRLLATSCCARAVSRRA